MGHTITQRRVRRWNEQAGKSKLREKSRAGARHPTKKETGGRMRHFADVSRRLALRSHMERLWSALLGRMFVAWGPVRNHSRKRDATGRLLKSLFGPTRRVSAFSGRREIARRQRQMVARRFGAEFVA